MRQQREAERDGYATALLSPRGPAEEQESDGDGDDERERERMRDRAVREGPSEVIDVGQSGAGGGNEADASGRRSLLGPRSDRKTDGGV